MDNATGGWGHINVDQIMLADAPARPASEAALWFDYGKDYYAAVSWSDIPKSDGRRLWIGWMNNWQYGGDEPTSPWRSAMSIPRQVGLRPHGRRHPAGAETGLRNGTTAGPAFYLQRRGHRRSQCLAGTITKITGQQLELVVELARNTGACRA